MAPRPPETFDGFVTRLQAALDEGRTEIRYGRYHHSHAVCVEDGVYRVRRLEHTPEEAQAYLRDHGIFMPEHAEAISTPRTLLFEATTIDALTAWLRDHWPT